MRKTVWTVLAIANLGAIASLGLAAPAAAGDASFWGTGVGAALGGLVGSTIGRGDGRLAATGAGVFLGGLVGNSVGTAMDRSYYAAPTYNYYVPGPYTSAYYAPNYVAPPAPINPPPRQVIYVQPAPADVVEYREATPTYVHGGFVGADGDDESSHYCREYTQRVRINGQLQETYGTACLQPDGTWQIVK